MHSNSGIDELLSQFRSRESRGRRGPSFKAVALALESLMRAEAVTKETIVAYFGSPDLFDENVFVYRFDHRRPGRNRDEWYFHFESGLLINSGYNVRGVNDLSRLTDGAQFSANS